MLKGNCRVCGKEFEAVVSANRKYCSIICYRVFTTESKWKRLRLLEEAQIRKVAEIRVDAPLSPNMIIFKGKEVPINTPISVKYGAKVAGCWVKRICRGCDKGFEARISHIIKTPNSGWFCSNFCRKLKTRLTLRCQACFIPFQVNAKYHSKQKYCSKKCYNAVRTKNSDYAQERHRQATQCRRGRIKKVKGIVTSGYFTWLCAKLDYACQLCGRKKEQCELTVDHIVPISKGGIHDNSNIQPLCSFCNTKKGANTFNPSPNIAKFYLEYQHEYSKNAGGQGCSV